MVTTGKLKFLQDIPLHKDILYLNQVWSESEVTKGVELRRGGSEGEFLAIHNIYLLIFSHICTRQYAVLCRLNCMIRLI